MEVKYSFSLVAIFSEPVKVSSFIINSSGRSLEETRLLLVTDRRWRHKNLESLESEIESEKYFRFAARINWRVLLRYRLKSDQFFFRLLSSRSLCIWVISESESESE